MNGFDADGRLAKKAGNTLLQGAIDTYSDLDKWLLSPLLGGFDELGNGVQLLFEEVLMGPGLNYKIGFEFAAIEAATALYIVKGTAAVAAVEKAAAATETKVITSAEKMAPRLAQDIKVNPSPPSALPTSRPVGKSPTQNAVAQADVAAMEEAGYTDIRVNQQQVNAAGERVGINKPDVQGTSPSGTREYIEYDTKASGRGPGHEQRIIANDPAGKVQLKIVD